MPYDVQQIIVEFSMEKKVTRSQAREMLAQMVNEHEKIRPYLREYPFTPLGARIRISFDKTPSNPYNKGRITSIFVDPKDLLYYSVVESTNPIKKIYITEPYAEAEAIVREEQSAAKAKVKATAVKE